MERKNESDAGIFLKVPDPRRKRIPVGVAVNDVRSNLVQPAERVQNKRPSNSEIRMSTRIAVAFSGKQGYFVTALPKGLREPPNKRRYAPGHRRGIGCEQGDSTQPRPPMYHKDCPPLSKIL